MAFQLLYPLKASFGGFDGNWKSLGQKQLRRTLHTLSQRLVEADSMRRCGLMIYCGRPRRPRRSSLWPTELSSPVVVTTNSGPRNS